MKCFYDEKDLLTFGFKELGKNVKIKKNVSLFFTENISIGDNVRIDDFTIIVASKDPVLYWIKCQHGILLLYCRKRRD